MRKYDSAKERQKYLDRKKRDNGAIKEKFKKINKFDVHFFLDKDYNVLYEGIFEIRKGKVITIKSVKAYSNFTIAYNSAKRVF